MIRTEIPAPTTALIAAVERALIANDGDALEAAWFSLYALDPAQAVHVANIMRPLAAVPA